jgi:hypothetical protein
LTSSLESAPLLLVGSVRKAPNEAELSWTTHRIPSRSVTVSQPLAAALRGRLVCTSSSEHILTPALAAKVALLEHLKTVIVSYSEQS